MTQSPPPAGLRQLPRGAETSPKAEPPAVIDSPAGASAGNDPNAGESPTGGGRVTAELSIPPAADPGEPPIATMPSPPPAVLRPPRLLEGTAVYPADALVVTLDRQTMTPALRRAALEGRVVLKVLVQVDGSAGHVEVLDSSGRAILDGAAREAARSWRFEPATRDGQPIEAWAMIPVRFVVP